MTRSFRKRGWIVLVVLMGSAFLAVYVLSRPHLAPGQKPLTDIRSIETLRTQFNQDAGQTRLIILVSPT
jgi:hypothetical protein